MTGEEVQVILDKRTRGAGTACGRACFDGRHTDCGWRLTSGRFCRCTCHPMLTPPEYEW